MSMTLLQRVEIGSAGAATIDFTSIPQIYTDLRLVISARASGGSYPGEISWNMGISFNASTTGFSTRHLNGNGSSATSSSPVRLAGYMGGASATSNTFGNATIDILNYTSNTYKSFSSDSVSENSATTTYSNIVAGLWSNTAAITSISLDTEYGVGGNWIQGSTASLYGINRQSAIGKPKAIGGAIAFANGFWYHTFTGSGTFSPQANLSCEALVVAGGGSGGDASSGTTYRHGGGGGAGGFLTTVASVSAGISYPVLVGAGGSPGTPGVYNPNASVSNSGINSSALGVTALGGGAGLSYGVGLTGGSGGGSGGQNDNYVGGTGTAGQGNNGGRSGSGYPSGGGGGGGAGGAGANGGNGTSGGGVGGPGLPWAGSYYAGGGAGGGGTSSGGIGGGGSATGTNTTGNPGTANTGGGGAGSLNSEGNTAYGGAGGSGIVIIRYPAE